MPTLPNSSKLASFDNMFNPWGPNNVPANINPIMCGILNRLRIGAHRIITMTNRNMAIGSVRGNVGNKFVKWFICKRTFFGGGFCFFVKYYIYLLRKVSDFFWMTNILIINTIACTRILKKINKQELYFVNFSYKRVELLFIVLNKS